MIVCLLLKEGNILEHRRDRFVLWFGKQRERASKKEESVSLSLWACVFVCLFVCL